MRGRVRFSHGEGMDDGETGLAAQRHRSGANPPPGTLAEQKSQLHQQKSQLHQQKSQLHQQKSQVRVFVGRVTSVKSVICTNAGQCWGADGVDLDL